MDNLLRKEVLEKITQKKEFSQLPKKDVELALDKFDKPKNPGYQKVKLTRSFLRDIFSSFSSRKLLGPRKEKSPEWFLMKHKSSKERLSYYHEVYERIFSGMKKCTIIDLGAGVNGFSYGFLEKSLGTKPKYVAVEAIGQLVDLMNAYFEENGINGKAFHESIFEKEKILELIKKQPSPKTVLLMKVIDSLETVRRNYSKEIILDISSLADKIALSFAVRSLGKRQKFSANRNWITNFIKDNFNVLDDFEIGGERYIVFESKKSL